MRNAYIHEVVVGVVVVDVVVVLPVEAVVVDHSRIDTQRPYEEGAAGAQGGGGRQR